MFTGIIEEIGTIKEIVQGSLSIQISIKCKTVLSDVKLGDSIAVNGICLTIKAFGYDWFMADVMPETIRKTSLNSLKITDKVNLERALRLSDRLGGHIVSGHIDGTGILTAKKEEDNAIWLTIEADEHILKYIILKGSVALDGTSLTIAYVDENSFKVSLIPHTAEKTTLCLRKSGDLINIECDLIGKYVEKISGYYTHKPEKVEKINLDFLKNNGFI